MSNDVYAQLARRFAPEDHKLKNGLTYVDGEMVITRLNEELGLGGWSFEVKDVKILDNEVWALGRMTVYGPDRNVVREQAGGQIINRKRTGEVIELANDIKGAITDCLKKCATLIGVGLYLFNPAERREVEQDMQQAKRQPARPVQEEQHPQSDGPFACVECGDVLAPTLFKDGTEWTLLVLAQYGRRKHGRVLCMHHYREANRVQREEEAKLGQAAG